MALYEKIAYGNVYGLRNGRHISKLNYILEKAKEQENPALLKKIHNEVVNTRKELENEKNSKYNLFKKKEPQSISTGSGFNFKKTKKQFTF